MTARSLCAVAVGLALGLVCLAADRATAAVSVATNDGMVLTLGDDGSWDSLTVDSNAVPELSGATGGFLVHRMEGVRIPYQRDAWYPGTLVTGTATQVGGDIQLTGSAEGLSFDISLTGGGPYIGVDGTVTGPGTDRVFLLYFRIPVDADGWLWANDVNDVETISSSPSNWYFSGYHFHQARHPDMSDNPFGTITKTAAPAMGLSLSPLFYPPCAYSIQYNGNGGFWIEFELGVTPQTTKHPNTADFHFVLYKHDPKWGNRSAVDRYYSFFPQWFQRVSRGGNWMTDYGTRPTSPGDFSIVYFQTYLWDDQWIRDNDLYGCKYQEPWCWHLDWLTEAELEQKALDIPENDPPYCPAKGQSIKESAQQAILSGCKNPDGSYIGPDDVQHWTDGSWDCDGQITTVRYITNPDPEIPNWRGFNPGRSRAQSVMYWEWYREWGQEPGPGDTYSGLYHDSTTGWWAGWGVVHNFAPEHWDWYDYSPGIYQGWDYAPGQVSMWAPMSNVEFLKAAHEQMALEDRVVIANSGPNYELFMAAPWLDMIGAGEGYSSELHHHSIVRAIAAQKPCSFWGERTEAAIKECMLMGIYPGFGDGSNYESYRSLYQQYMPVLDTLDDAGWEPITAAKSSNTNVCVERHGPDDNGVIYLVARAPSRRSSADITVYSDDLGWPAHPDVTVTELLYGGAVSTSYDGDGNLVISTGTIGRTDNRVYKLVPGLAPQPPAAEFSGNPTTGTEPLTVSFTDLSTGGPTSWSWDFGDTGTDAVQNPSHIYTAASSYTVSLTAYNAQGQDTETKPDYITVNPGQPPVADFVGNPTGGSAPLTVSFTDQSINSPTSWDWDFGDTGADTVQNPSHTYGSAGDYTVSLTVTNPYGQDTETKTDYISVTTGGGQDYFCYGLSLTTGTVVSGDHTSVHGSDDVYLVVASAKQGGKQGTFIDYFFDTGLSSLSSLTVTFESHPTIAPQLLRIRVYNWASSGWDQFTYEDITSTEDSVRVVPIASPSDYLSPTGEVHVRIRTGDKTRESWDHYIDEVKISAAP